MEYVIFQNAICQRLDEGHMYQFFKDTDVAAWMALMDEEMATIMVAKSKYLRYLFLN